MADIMILNFPPNQCPNCGHKFNFKDRSNYSDFINGAAHTCPDCRTQFQYATTPALLSIAPDVKYYHDNPR